MSKGVDSQSNKRYVLLGASPIVFYSVNTSGAKLDLETVGPEVPTWGGNNNGICETNERCIFGDHIEMAAHLLAEGYKDAAAVIAGGVLEAHLRLLAQNRDIEVPAYAAWGGFAREPSP